MVFVPVFAQESTNSTDKILELKNQVDELITKTDNLQNLNIGLENQVKELKDKVSDFEERGLKSGINETALGLAISSNDKGITQGDVLNVSATIVGFFGFGSFIAIRFQSDRRIVLAKLMKFVYYVIGFIIIMHLFVIGSIIEGKFNIEHLYFYVIAITISGIFVIILSMRDIITEENKRKNVEEKSEIDANAIGKLIDDKITKRTGTINGENM